MQTINDTQLAAVCGGTTGLFPTYWVTPSQYDLRTNPYIRAQWDLWGPDRIGGYPRTNPF